MSRDHHRDGYPWPSLWLPRRGWHPSSAVFEGLGWHPGEPLPGIADDAPICHRDQGQRAVGTTASADLSAAGRAGGRPVGVEQGVARRPVRGHGRNVLVADRPVLSGLPELPVSLARWQYVDAHQR